MGRFFLGFAIGAAASAAVVLATTPRAGVDTRQQITNTYDYARQRITRRVREAMDEGRYAAAAHERELWSEFHKRLEHSRQEDE
jgi:gas vesicle protein